MPLPISSLRVAQYTVPTETPESDGTLAWNSTSMVLVEVTADRQTGLGYSYTHGAAATLVDDLLRSEIVDHEAMDVGGAYQRMRTSVRNVGDQGIAAAAISAVDVALWDLKARLLNLSLLDLLGAVRASVPIYGSGGFTSYDDQQLTRQLGDWVADGISRVKMKVGREPTDDVRRVQIARHAIGPDAELFVDANGAYDRQQALRLSHAFAAEGATWFEEPVSSDDLEGLRVVRRGSPPGVEIAAGEYLWTLADTQALLQSDAIDALQLDATRCGGITGFLASSALCQAHRLPLSAHTAPALHAHLGCAVAGLRHIEWFFDHVRIERTFFDGFLEPEAGQLRPDRTRPGHGLLLKSQDARPYRKAGS